MTYKQPDEQIHKKLSQWNFVYIFIISATIFAALFLAVTNLQLVEGSQFSQRADRNKVEFSYTYPLRGVIFDREGNRLAENIASTNLILKLNSIYTEGKLDETKLVETLSRINEVLGEGWFKPRVVNGNEITDPLAYMKTQVELVEEKDGHYARFSEIELVTSLDNDQTISLKAGKSKLEGLKIEEGNKRNYPMGAEFSHLLGYTSLLTAEDLEYIDYLGYEKLIALNGYKDIVGRLGVEATHDQELSGQKGVDAVETDAFGSLSSGVSRSIQPVSNGKNLHLSISSAAQKKMYEVLREAVKKHNATGAVGIVQNVENGEIIVLSSYPSFDNNEFIGGISNAKYQEYLNNEQLPLLNRSISAQLPPGSTFKTLTAIAALDSGQINEKTVFVSRQGYTFSNGAPFQEYQNRSYGALTINDAIQVSSNIFFCETIRNWDINKLTPYYEKFGIGKRTGIDLQGEAEGRLPSPENKIALAKIPGITWLDPVWYPEGDGCNTVIGQGIALVTPLQMSNWVAAIANGGTLHTPHLGTYYSEGSGVEKIPIEVKPIAKDIVGEKSLDIVKRGMRSAVDGPRRSIHALTDAKVEIAAKTGTAEFGALNSKGVYEHTHAWVTGFFPYKSPKYSFVLLLEDGGESFYAAEEFRVFVDWWVEQEGF